MPATTNPVLGSLRSAFEEKRAAAQQAWQTFAAERDGLTGAGVDLTKDAGALKKLDDLHEVYKGVADEALDLQRRLLRAIDGKGEGLPRDTARDGMTSVGAQFLKALGVGGVGLKALDGTTGGSMVGPFFDPRIRELPQRGLFVRSLIPVRNADGDKVWYLRQTVAD